MKVLKFGGTSVGCSQNIHSVKNIVFSQKDDIVVVVSALGGITDKILNAARMASMNMGFQREEFDEIKRRHYGIIQELFAEPADIKTEIDVVLDELEQVLTGVTLVNELTPKTMDRLLGMGERMSSIIISQFFSVELKVSFEFIVTDNHFGKANVDYDETNRLIRENFANFSGIVVVPGFIASSHTGEYTTLGRGGSDYTAAIIAAALNASALEIWTDVDGFMTADPRIIRKAYTIPSLSYTEAMELSNFGAKVIYPPTILPVYKKDIPVYIKNTMRPHAPGTLITNTRENGKERLIKGISSISRIALLTVQGIGMVGVAGISMRLFSALAGKNINVILISQASSENTISVAIEEHAAEVAEKAIRREFALEISHEQINYVDIETGLSIVAIVGEAMKHTTGIAGKLFTTIGRNGINIVAIAQGASEYNISWVVQNEDLRKTLNVVHESFFLSENAELNLFLMGTGLVGSSLLKQIASQQEKLLNESHLRLKIAGIANSRKMAFCRDGIDVADYKNVLDASEIPSIIQGFVSKMVEMNMYNSVFVDCTASDEIALEYLRILDENISVVTANKVAASSKYDNYMSLKRTAKSKGVKFLFETNVGAGLPIINTLNDLVNSGDKVFRIEAVLSGTLNFIFNTISPEIPMSKAIRLAQEAGYAEPDPRIDLSGVDVVRKLLILARESGYRIDKEDVEVNSFIPAEYFESDIKTFWDKIPQLDADFEARRQKLEANNQRWRFVASFENGNAEAGLREIESTHPFYDLEGSNNLIIYQTERYNEFPMLIKGYGAGAEVTAAGVFADIIRISNI
ncbi:MAG: bifunctional aspartate kinase/homoserine dehydrogenase I [Prolixibacteraceae bacterium]|nr:bifunctional aspartate kinase/homoserine dehydrogenase I [Prolixibacteraceae bacterium]